MALPVNIDDLINHRKVECARIEYKAGWNPEKVLHTLCAFANDIDNWGGGYVILGVEEKNGKPVFLVKGLVPDSVDKIQKELLNICHLIEPVSKGDRNRRVGEFLKELDLAEARNTGYSVILSAVSANGSPRPKLETNPHRDYFTFMLPIHKLFLKSDAEIVEELNPTDPVSEGINEGINEGIKTDGEGINGGVLKVIAGNPGSSAPFLARLFGKSLATTERNISALIAAGKVEHRGSKKTGGYYAI